MNWQGKPIDQLTDDELREAIRTVAGMDGYRFDRLLKKKKRHEKIDLVENPNFTQLTTELNNEILKRKLGNV